jgi:hypothetical protein
MHSLAAAKKLRKVASAGTEWAAETASDFET